MRVAVVVKPTAAAAVATTFGFPLVLMIAVLLFLLVQGRPRCARSEAAEGASVDGRCRAPVPGRGTSVSRADRAIATERFDYSALSDRMGHLLVLRFAMGAIVVAWAALRPEVRRHRVRGPPGRHRRLPRRVDGRSKSMRRRIGSVRVRAPDRPAPVRWALSGVRDVRHRRHPESDPLPGLPRPGRRLAPRLVSDRAQDRALALAAAVRRPLRPGRQAGPADRGHRRGAPSSSTACRSSTSPRSGCSRSRPRPSRRSTNASFASVAVGPPVDGRGRRPARRRERPARAVAARPGGPRRAIRVQARHRRRRLRRQDARAGHARTEDVPTTAADPDWIVRRAWDRHEVLPVKRLDPDRRPVPRRGASRRAEPDRRADDRRRPAGRRDRRRVRQALAAARRRAPRRLDGRPVRLDGGAEPAQRRPAATRPGPGRARFADRCRQSPDVPAEPRARARDERR